MSGHRGSLQTLYFLPTDQDANTIILQLDKQAGELELPDMLVDTIWCYNSENTTLVIGSEYGRFVYFIDTLYMRITQVLNIEHVEDKEWNKCVIQVTPENRRVIVYIENRVMILTWQGTIVLGQTVSLNDSLKLIEKDRLIFENLGEADDNEFIIHIPQ